LSAQLLNELAFKIIKRNTTGWQVSIEFGSMTLPNQEQIVTTYFHSLFNHSEGCVQIYSLKVILIRLSTNNSQV